MRRLLKGNRKEWASRPQLTGMEQTLYTQRFLRGIVKKKSTFETRGNTTFKCCGFTQSSLHQ